MATSTTCPTCHSPFTPKRPWQRFDSPACRRAYHKSGGETGLAQKVAELEKRIIDLERMVWPTGK